MRILFFISRSYSIPIVQPLIKELKNKEIDYRVIQTMKTPPEFVTIIDQKNLISDIQEAIRFNPDFVIIPGNFVHPDIPGIKVEIFHGIGVEKPSHYKIRHFFDVYCTSGPYVTKRFKELQQKYGYFLVRETGWLKVDHILNYPVSDLHTKFQLPENSDIVLYAPTCSRRMHSAKALLKIMPEIIAENEVWLIKFHELMDKKIIKKYQELNDSRVRIIKNHDITPYLHLANVLISDTSSVVYEFLILNKPVITYRTRKLKDKCDNINRISELRNVLNKCLNYPDRKKTARTQYLDQINPYLDGKTSERILKVLKSLHREGFSPAGHKPKNLLRTRIIKRNSKND